MATHPGAVPGASSIVATRFLQPTAPSSTNAHIQRPNGWRVSGEPRSEAQGRVRCTRGLGGDKLRRDCSRWNPTGAHFPDGRIDVAEGKLLTGSSCLKKHECLDVGHTTPY